MKLFNVKLKQETTIVVLADDEDDAYDIALDTAKTAINAEAETPIVHITGEINSASQLRDGWDEASIPYGWHGNRRIGEILENRVDDDDE